MSNETHGLLNPGEESKKLHQLYVALINGKIEPSTDQQKKTMMQLLNTKITVLDQKTTRIKFLHYALRISAMLLSGIATVILGLKFTNNDNSKWPIISSNLALGITATVTFLTGLSVFWDTDNYWKRVKVMLNKLKELRYEYVFLISGDNVKQADLKDILNRYLDALGDEYWENLLKNASKTKDEDKNKNSTMSHSS
jgi:hypothetical protein